MTTVNVSSEDDPIVFDIWLEEDIEAELEEFVFLTRLGLYQEASELIYTVLKDHQRLFPVFAEIAGFFFEQGQIDQLRCLLDDLKFNSVTFDDVDKQHSLSWLDIFVTFNLEAGADHREPSWPSMIGHWLIYLNSRHEYRDCEGKVCPLSSAQIQSGEVLCFLALNTSYDTTWLYSCGTVQIRTLLEHHLYWEAVQIFAMLTQKCVIKRPNDRLLSLSQVVTIYDDIQDRLPKDGETDTMLCDLRTKYICLHALQHNTESDDSEKIHALSRELPSQMRELLKVLHKPLPDPYPRGKYENFLQRFEEAERMQTRSPEALQRTTSDDTRTLGPSSTSQHGSASSGSAVYRATEDPSIVEHRIIGHQLLACPYNKYDPQAFGAADPGYSSCETWYGINIAQLKQHLLRAHSMPEHMCDRCGLDTKYAIALDYHRRRDPLCEIQELNSLKLMPETQKELGFREEPTVTSSRAVYWYRVFDTIFGSDTRKERGMDPYYKGPISTIIDALSEESLRKQTEQKDLSGAGKGDNPKFSSTTLRDLLSQSPPKKQWSEVRTSLPPRSSDLSKKLQKLSWDRRLSHSSDSS